MLGVEVVPVEVGQPIHRRTEVDVASLLQERSFVAADVVVAIGHDSWAVAAVELVILESAQKLEDVASDAPEKASSAAAADDRGGLVVVLGAYMHY
jgi:hypothetical protein